MADLSSFRRLNPGLDDLNDDELSSALQKLGYTADGSIINKDAEPEQPKDDSDFYRGIKDDIKQVPTTLYGLGAGLAATAESAVGEGGLATGIKNGLLGKYQEGQQEIAKTAKPSDEWDYSLNKAKEGDLSALVDFAQYGLGHAVSQGAQAFLTAGLGSIGAKAIAKNYIEKEVAKEIAKGVSEQEATKLVTQKVANIGSAAALYGMGTAQEGGEIGGGLAQKTQDENRTLTADEIGKGFAATLAAGGLEAAGDKLGLDALAGKLPFMKNSNRAVRGAIGGITTAPAEYGTEYGQTLLEEAGKGNDWNSDEAHAQARTAGAMGAIGGGAIGGVAGVLSPRPVDRPSALGQAVDQEISQANQSTGQGNITPQQFDDITREARASTPYSDGTTQEQNDLLNQASDRIREQARQSVNPGDIVNPNTSLDESLRVADELVSNAGKTTDNINPIISTLSEQPSQLPVERQQSQPDVIPSPLEGELLPPDAALRQPVAGLIESDAFDQTPEELRAQKNAATRELIQRLSALNKPEAINATIPDNANTTTGTPTGEPTVTPDSRAATPNPASSEQPDSEVPTNVGEPGSATPQSEPVVTNDSLAEDQKFRLDNAINSARKNGITTNGKTVEQIEDEVKQYLLSTSGKGKFDQQISANKELLANKNKEIRDAYNSNYFKTDENGELTKNNHDHFESWHEGGGVDSDIGSQFDAHGIAKSNQLGSLLYLLNHGVNKDRGFDTAPLVTKGNQGSLHLGSAGGAYKDGAFIVTSAPGKTIREYGITNVLVSDHVASTIPTLKKQYPDINFIPYSKAQEELSKQISQSSNGQASNPSEVSNLLSGNETDFATNQENNDVLPANQEKEQETRNTLTDIATESQNISKENANQQETNRPESIAAKEAITPPVQDQKANDALDQSVDLSGNQKAIDYFKSKGFTESEANEILDKRSELRKANDLGKLDGYLNGRFDRSRIRNIDNLDPLFDIDNQVDKPKPVVKEPEEQQDSKPKPKPFYQMTLDEYVNNSKASHAKYRPDKPFNEDGAVATYKEIVSNAIRDKKNVPDIALKDYQKLTENNDKTNKTNAGANGENGAETIVPAVADSQVTGQAGSSSARSKGEDASQAEARGDDNSGQGSLNFLTKKVADKHIADNNLTDTHHAVKDSKRWYVVEKPTTTTENKDEAKTNEANATDETGQEERLLDNAAPKADAEGAVNDVPEAKFGDIGQPNNIKVKPDSFDEFLNKKDKLGKGQAKSKLTKEYAPDKDGNRTLKDVIENRVNNGWTIKEESEINYDKYHKDEQKLSEHDAPAHPLRLNNIELKKLKEKLSDKNNYKETSRKLVSPDGEYHLDQKAIGKIGLDYAEHLLSQSPENTISKPQEQVSDNANNSGKGAEELSVNNEADNSSTTNKPDSDKIPQEEYSKKLSEYEKTKSELDAQLKKLKSTSDELTEKLNAIDTKNISIDDIINSGIDLSDVKVKINGTEISGKVALDKIRENNIEEKISQYDNFIKCCKGK
jgi:hypothetical protein